MKKANEYRAFTNLAGRLLSVPHDEVKSKLDEEKREKKKRKKPKASSASDREATDR
jgi:hypothetical protein